MPTAPSRRGSEAIAGVAEKYYDSADADQFYFRVWGGEDIHIGIYEHETESIANASRRTVQQMASLLGGLGAGQRVIDFGAGYGGAARYLAQRYDVTVTALNLSAVQNERNRALCRKQGLEGAVEVVHGSFEDVPRSNASYDVVWSQDALLHSGDRARVLAEARRLLKPGGTLIFTDPMQSDDCPSGVLQPVYDRIHLDSLGSFAFYREATSSLGMREVQALPMTPQLVRHYTSVYAELRRRYEELVGFASRQYVDRMLEGLLNWVRAGKAGYLAWGILAFEVP